MSAPPNMPAPGLYAFPYSIQMQDGMGGTYYQNCPGMTLRDYFAAAAIPEAIRAVLSEQAEAESMEGARDTVARFAYEVADAMLKRRASTP